MKHQRYDRDNSFNAMWTATNFFNDPFEITLIFKFLPTVSWLIHPRFAGGYPRRAFAFTWKAGEAAFGTGHITSIKDQRSSFIQPRSISDPVPGAGILCQKPVF